MSDATERAWFVAKPLRVVQALAKTQRVCVVKEVSLVHAGFAFVHSAHARVLLIEPRALHVRLLLRVERLRVHLAYKVGNAGLFVRLERALVRAS